METDEKLRPTTKFNQSCHRLEMLYIVISQRQHHGSGLDSPESSLPAGQGFGLGPAVELLESIAPLSRLRSLEGGKNSLRRACGRYPLFGPSHFISAVSRPTSPSIAHLELRGGIRLIRIYRTGLLTIVASWAQLADCDSLCLTHFDPPPIKVTESSSYFYAQYRTTTHWNGTRHR